MAQIGIEQGGRTWGGDEAARYARSKHGPDGRHLLDPGIDSFLFTARARGPLLDVGTGAASVAIEAVTIHGVSFVYGLDKFPAMVARADQAIREANLSKYIALQVADAAHLPFADSSFNRIMSVNVGCNLDNPTLAAYLREMRRVLIEGGRILFTVPTNLGVVFSNGDTSVLLNRLKEGLAAIEEEATAAEGIVHQIMIQRHLGDIQQMHRGTFVMRDGHLRLVADDSIGYLNELQPLSTRELQEAEPIWRKLPGLAVPNNFHTEVYYEEQIREAGLLFGSEYIGSKYIGCFPSEEARNKYNDLFSDSQQDQRLGREYVGKGPFAVYILQRA